MSNTAAMLIECAKKAGDVPNELKSLWLELSKASHGYEWDKEVKIHEDKLINSVQVKILKCLVLEHGTSNIPQYNHIYTHTL